MNTIITEKNERGEEVAYDVFSKLIESRILFLHDYITDEIATDIVATLLYLDHENEDKISLYLNCGGGSIESIFMIYDMMKLVKSPISTLCMGEAMNEAVLLLAAGTKNMRFATKSSFICINQLGHNYSQHADMSRATILLEQSKKENARFVEELSNCTGKSVKTLIKGMDRDLFLSPVECVKWNIIDEVIGVENETKKKRK
jgi:ATP-dependent Clp protease protease subunit